jgi:purine-binding chemotaxis protein CheW
MDLADIRKKGLKAKGAEPKVSEPERVALQPPDPLPALPKEGPANAPDQPLAAAAEEKPGAPVETGLSIGLVTFFLGSEGYAVAVEEVQEVVPPAAIVPIPRTRPEIAGLFTLRGAMIPLFRIRTMLELPGGETREGTERFLVVTRDNFPAALPIDRLGQVLSVTEGSIKPPPPFLKGIRGEYLRGIIDIQGQVFGILNLARILPAAVRPKERGKEGQ